METQVIKLIIEALAGFLTKLDKTLGVDGPIVAPAPVAPIAVQGAPPGAATAPVPVVAPAAVVAPVAAAPVVAPVAAAPVVAPVADVVLDTEGIPHDKRIHSSGKTTYKKKAENGTPAGGWKLKKGVDPVLVAQIKTELHKQYNAPAVVTPGGAGSPVAPVAPVVAPVTASVTEYGAITTWGELMRQVVVNNIDRTIVDTKCLEFGVANLAELQNVPQRIPNVAHGIGLTKDPVVSA